VAGPNAPPHKQTNKLKRRERGKEKKEKGEQTEGEVAMDQMHVTV
jgi:hypothetical protein